MIPRIDQSRSPRVVLKLSKEKKYGGALWQANWISNKRIRASAGLKPNPETKARLSGKIQLSYPARCSRGRMLVRAAADSCSSCELSSLHTMKLYNNIERRNVQMLRTYIACIWMCRNFSLTDQIQFSAANWQERVYSRNSTFVLGRNRAKTDVTFIYVRCLCLWTVTRNDGNYSC